MTGCRVAYASSTVKFSVATLNVPPFGIASRCVDSQVEENLLNLPAVRANGLQVGCAIRGQQHMFTDGAAQEGLDLPNDAIEIEHFEVPHLFSGRTPVTDA